MRLPSRWFNIKEKDKFKILLPTSGQGFYVNEYDLRKIILKILWFYGYLAGSSLGTLGFYKMSHDSYGDVVPTHKVYKIIDTTSSKENPLVEIIWRHARSIWRNYGDGLKTSLIIAYKLYERALKLIEKGIAPSQIVDGYLIALKVHLDTLKELSFKAGQVPCDIALRSLFWTSPIQDKLSKIFCNTMRRCKTGYLSECIDVERVEGGSIYDTFSFKGVAIRKSPSRLGMPRFLYKARVAVLNTKIYINLRGENIKFIVNDVSLIDKFKGLIMEKAFELIKKLKELDVKLVVNLKGIDPLIEEKLELNGISVIKRIPEEKFKLIMRSTGAKVIEKIYDIDEEKLGLVDYMWETKFGNRKYVLLSNSSSPITTIMLRGPWYQIDTLYDEIRMAARGAEVYMKDPRVLPAGGAPEIEASIRIKELARSFGDARQLVLETYSEAVKIVPETLARHSGLNPLEAVLELERLHYEGNWAAGINEYERKIENNVINKGLVDIYEIRRNAIESGVRLAITFLRLSGIYISKKGEEMRKIKYKN
jgi:chaperonin GroEL (HSP60 family)